MLSNLRHGEPSALGAHSKQGIADDEIYPPVRGLVVAHARSSAFDGVSIKISPPDNGSTVSSRGGPGTRAPGVWTCQLCPFPTLSGLPSISARSAERFGLKVHRGEKEVPGYELTVVKNGRKLRNPAPSRRRMLRPQSRSLRSWDRTAFLL